MAPGGPEAGACGKQGFLHVSFSLPKQLATGRGLATGHGLFGTHLSCPHLSGSSASPGLHTGAGSAQHPPWDSGPGEYCQWPAACRPARGCQSCVSRVGMEEPGVDEHRPPTATPLPVWHPHLCATLPFLMSEMIRGSPLFLLAAVEWGRQAVNLIFKGPA